MRLLLLSAEQSKERRLRDAHNLETDSRNISDSVTRTTESSNQDLVVLVHKVQATIARHERSDLLSVLDQLDTHALTNGRVGLLGLHSANTSQSTTNTLHLLQNDSLSHRSSSQDVGLNRRDVVSLLVVLFESTPHSSRLPYQPIARYDGPHAAYEQHEYHKAFYSHTVRNERGEKRARKRDFSTSINNLPLTHSMDVTRTEEELLFCEICDEKSIGI